MCPIVNRLLILNWWIGSRVMRSSLPAGRVTQAFPGSIKAFIEMPCIDLSQPPPLTILARLLETVHRSVPIGEKWPKKAPDRRDRRFRQDESQGFRERTCEAPTGTGSPANLGPSQGCASDGGFRGSRHRRQGRRDQPHYRSHQPPRLPARGIARPLRPREDAD